ncbi:hypothetical protein EBR78_06445, partial [bacterium]|nr:hypothetical protein [bacterium]
NFSQIMWAPLLGPNFLPNPSIALGTDQISGWVSEITEDGTVHGWATDLKDPNTALDLKLIIDGNRFAEQRKIARSVNYQKLYEWGIITKSQFMLSIPDTYLDGRRHRIQIEATSTLSNSSIILGSSSDANEFQLRNRALTSRLAGTECLSPVSRCASSNYDFGAPNFTEDTGFADSKNYFSLWNCQSTNGVNVIRKLNIMSLGKRDLRTQPDSLYSTEIHPLTKSPIIYFNTARLNKSDRNQWSIKKALFEGERWKIYDVFDLPSHRYGVSSPDGKFPNGFLFQDYNQPGWAPSSAFQRRDTSIPGVSKFPANSEHTSFPLEGWGPLGITAIRNYIQPPPYVDGGPTGRTCLHMNPKLFEYDNNTPTKLAVFIFRVSPTQDSNCVLPTGENLVPGYYVYQYDPKLGWQFLPGQTAPITSHQAIKLAGDRQETGKPLFLAGGWEGDIESITYGREGVVRTRLISCPGVHFGEATGSTKNLVTLAIDPTSPLVTHPTAAEPVFSFDIFYGYQQSPSQVIQVTPERGNNLGGVRVTLVGVDFVAGSKIFIGTSECGSPTWVSSRTMTCVVPALAAGFHTVKVVNPDGLASASLVRYEAVASRWEPVLNYSRPFGIEFCKKVCGNRSLTSVPSPEGARCASGEVIPRSSHPRVAFRHGCKPNRRCLPQGIVRGAINNYQYCYGPGQRRNNELTDVTMGCYCGL